MSIEDVIGNLEQQLLLQLDTARKTYAHRGDAGAAAEAAVRNVLSDYLPARMRVGQGEIIDTQGHRSPQTDIVIADEDHPATFTPDQPGLFFVEGLVAAGEVKSVLTSQSLEETFAKSRQFKHLRNYDLPGDQIFAKTNPAEDPLHICPPYFLVAFESQLSLETVQSKATEAKSIAAESGERILDGIFILRVGWAMDLGEGQGHIQAFNANAEPVRGWHSHRSQRTLFDFLTWVSAVRNRIIRLQPILMRYRLPQAGVPDGER